MGPEMTFVNERTTDEDKKKIDFSAISNNPYGNPKFNPGHPPNRWTVDRERDVFLSVLSYPRNEEGPKEVYFLFYWKGLPLPIRLDKYVVNTNDILWKRLGWWSCPENPRLRPDYAEILDVLKDALTVFGYNGETEKAYIVKVDAVRFDF